MSENGDGRQDGTFLPLPLPRQFSHEGRRGSLGKRLFTRQITFSLATRREIPMGKGQKIAVLHSTTSTAPNRL